MVKLFTTQYGSRLFGTQTPSSDIDIKHIILPDLGDLLLGSRVQIVSNKTNEVKNKKNSAEDIDEEFIPLQIFARDFVLGQTYALELAFAIDGNHCGQELFDPRGEVTPHIPHAVKVTTNWERAFWHYEEPLIVTFMKELREKFLTSNIKSMMGYAVSQANLYSYKGERLNTVRDVLALISRYDGDKTKKLESIANDPEWSEIELKYPSYFRRDTYDVGINHYKPCFKVLEKTLPFSNSIETSFSVLRSLNKKYGARSEQASIHNVDWKATMHAVRIVDEGINLLRDKKLSFPYPKESVDHLLAIKHGEIPIETVKDELSLKLDQLKRLEKETHLPAADESLLLVFDLWLKDWMMKFYGIGTEIAVRQSSEAYSCNA